MLTIPERILFSLATFLVVLLAARATHKLIKIIDRGLGKPEWSEAPKEEKKEEKEEKEEKPKEKKAKKK